MTESNSKPSDNHEQLVSEPTVKPTEITEQPVSVPTVRPTEIATKISPKTITKNPNRVIAGKKTAELMRQRRAEVKNNVIVVSKLKEPWMYYALGGVAVVGVIYIWDKYRNKSPSNKKSEPEPKVNVVQQSNLFKME